MRKYKINRDKERKLPPHAVSDKFKDFDKIRMQHSDITKRPTVPLYRNKKLFMLLLFITKLFTWGQIKGCSVKI